MTPDRLFLFGYALAYFLGTFPTGWLIARYALGFDVTKRGSGNIGMTNVMRTGGKIPGLATLGVDFGKGLAAVAVFETLNPEAAPHHVLGAGLASLLGHVLNVWLKFRGGKGVATHFGVWAWFDVTLFAINAAVWIAVFALTRLSSLSALTGILALLIACFMAYGVSWISALAFSSVLFLFWTHRENVGRLWRGEEKKLAAKNEKR